jgi:hypothetical protein
MGPRRRTGPNTFKGNLWLRVARKGMTTTFGLFQSAYQGTPLSSFTDLGLACCNEPIEVTPILARRGPTCRSPLGP